MTNPVEQQRQQFIARVSQATGVAPEVVDYWTTREGAYAPNGTGGLDFLNLRPYHGDPYQTVSPGGFERFGNVDDAVAATVRRIKQPFLQQFLQPALAKGPGAQWDAITRSGWDAGHYGRTGTPPATAAASPAAGHDAAPAAAPALDAARANLASFLIGNLQRHDHGSPQGLVGELQQLKPLVVAPPARTLETATAPASTPEPSSSKTSASTTLAGIPDAIATRSGIEVDASILPAVSRITQAFGVKVNSGYRSAEHNAAVGGAPESDHLRGDAVDFTGTPEQMASLYEWAQGKFPYVEPMNEAHDHVHVSFLR